ncbi:MAG: O-antigen ligase family protein [Acidobacteriaceae bacterium]|nr:O-antigen ligase family protein [Acidobacteriaceae bacterium]
MATTTLAQPLPTAFEQKSGTSFATRLLLIYAFMLYSRVFEAAMVWGVPNLYVMLMLSAAALAIVLFKGEFARAARSPVGLLLLLLTSWSVAVLPFSQWKSESLHVLTGVWLKSVAVYFIIVGLTKTFSDCRRVFNTFGWAAAASAVIMAVTNRIVGDRMTSVGSLGNSNEAAFHIMFGLPFIILLISRVNKLFKIPLALVGLLSLALSVKTASRAGLVMAAVLTVVALLKVSFANKFKILAVAFVALLVGALTIDQTALERYKTMFDSSDNSMEAASARESAESRKYLLREGIELTLTHPLFGVGMGVFPVAASELSKSRGEHPLWLASHNSYVQVSSEMGFVGLAIMVCAFAACLLGILRLDRIARRLQLAEVRSMSLCLLLSFTALMIHYFFDASAYDVYLPMAAGLCTSAFLTAQPLIERAEGGSSLVEGSPDSIAPPAVLVNQASGPQNRQPAIQGRNPYRLGRPRVAKR